MGDELSDKRLLTPKQQQAASRRDLAALLNIDPDLGTGLDANDLREARRRVLFPRAELTGNRFDITQAAEGPVVRGEIRGFYVITGVLTAKLDLGDLTCMRVITAGELVLIDSWVSESLPADIHWGTLRKAEIVVFDDRLALVAQRFPALMQAIHDRAGEQVHRGMLQQAINQLKRVEDRLLAWMWSIADRHGTVRSDGVWITVDVTHSQLAQLIGSRRPTVSLGLTRLSNANLLVQPSRGEWRLNPDSRARFWNNSPSGETASH